MDLHMIWWIWIIIGVIFLLIELFTTTFFALWMALAALIPALLCFIRPTASLEMQIIVWIIAMLGCSGLWGFFSKQDRPLDDMNNQIIGQIGVLASGCDTQTMGVVLLQKPIEGASQWKCIANDPIPTDARVIVIEKINPSLLRVELEKNNASPNQSRGIL